MAAFNLISCAGCGSILMSDGRHRYDFPPLLRPVPGFPFVGEAIEHQCISEEDVKAIPELVDRWLRA